jgi:hypothetical protein
VKDFAGTTRRARSSGRSGASASRTSCTTSSAANGSLPAAASASGLAILEYAKATFRKDRRLNIRLSSKDLEVIQKRALEEGLPYQTLVSSLLHKYASGRLREV